MTSAAWFDPLTYGNPAQRPPGRPPTAEQRATELNLLHATAAGRTPAGVEQARFLNAHGAAGIWREYAHQYRDHVSAPRGWAGTGLVAAAVGATSLVTQGHKWWHREERPYRADPTLEPIGPLPHDPSFPSGHASAAYAAATVLGSLWPERAAEFLGTAKLVGQSRVYSGVHYPSDVAAGARLGVAIASRMLGRPSATESGVTAGAAPAITAGVSAAASSR